VTDEGSENNGELFAALAAAIGDAQAARKDKRNKFHKYDYVSAEAIFATARGPLSKNGLSLIPVETFFRLGDDKGKRVATVARNLRLCHSSGQWITIITPDWPVEAGQGKPLDKALGGALTSSLRYALRDLLLIPQVEPGADVDQRDDREYQAPSMYSEVRAAVGQLVEDLPEPLRGNAARAVANAVTIQEINQIKGQVMKDLAEGKGA